MSKTMKRMMILALLTVVSVGLNAQEVIVAYNSSYEGGTVATKTISGQTVTITVTPSEGYYIEMKDIEVVSDAPDLRPYFEEADFMILPVFAGSGMKIKTCESLMYGKNILGSDESFEGYAVDAERVGGRCNTAEEYISRLRHFIQHPVPRFNRYSRDCFLKNYSEESSRAVFCSVFE